MSARRYASTLWMIGVACLVPLYAMGQITFERTYGGPDRDAGRSVRETSDGGYIIAGETNSFGAGSYDVYLIRTDSGGDTVWTSTYGGPSSDIGGSIRETDDGGYVVAGETYSFGAGGDDVYLIKTDGIGDTVWTCTFGGPAYDYGYSVRETSDGGYVIAGWTDSFGAGLRDVYLIKTDSGGDTMWTRTYGGPGTDEGRSLVETSDGGYIIAGGTLSFGMGAADVYLIKTDSGGDTVWTRTYGGSAGDVGQWVLETSDGGYVIAGRTESFGAGSYDVYLIKTDSAGDTMWTCTYGGPAWDEGYSVVETSDGGYVIAGRTESFGAGSEDVYLIKTGGAGDTVWTRTYGGPDTDWGRSVEETNDGGYIIAGLTWSFGAGSEDVYLIKTDADGLVGVNHAPDLFDQPDTTVAENEYLTFTLQAIDPELDTIWFSSPDLPAGATLDSAGGVFEWTPDDQQAGVYMVTFIATDVGEPALADTEETQITVTEVGVSSDEDGLRVRAQYLAQNRPNPFGAATTILYSVRARQPVSLRIYDIRGALVRELLEGTVGAGVHRVSWDGRDGRGREVGSGIYFCRLEAGEFSETRRMVLLR